MGFTKKAIQNPYRHQKNSTFQGTTSSDKKRHKSPVSLDIKGLRGNRRQQPPTSKNRLYRVGKDEVGGSNPPSSSTQTL
jgi:hypothetical protein